MQHAEKTQIKILNTTIKLEHILKYNHKLLKNATKYIYSQIMQEIKKDIIEYLLTIIHSLPTYNETYRKLQIF